MHLFLLYKHRGLLVRDLGSKHGTFVNGKRIGTKDGSTINQGNGRQQLLYLKDGFELRFGRVCCKVIRKKQEPVLHQGFVANPEVARQREMERIQKNLQLQQKEKEKEKEKRKREWVQRCTADNSVATSSSTFAVPVQIPKSDESNNIGMQMMAKMGWNENSSSSMGSVIEVVQREERVGLGCEFTVPTVSGGVEDTAQSRRAAVWKKAQQRFQALDEDVRK